MRRDELDGNKGRIDGFFKEPYFDVRRDCCSECNDDVERDVFWGGGFF